MADSTVVAGPAISSSDIKTQVGDPEPYDRTEIGVGESMSLWLEDIEDQDTAIDGDTSYPVYEAVEATWSARR